MEHHDPHIAKKLQPLRELSLSAREKVEMRELLQEFMEFKPKRATPPARRTSFLFGFKPLLALSLCAALVLTTTTAAAAEQALPGDLLYPVKVHVNEEVRAFATASTEEKAAWALERAERRLDEALLLDSEQRLTEERRHELADAVDKHLAHAEVTIALVPQDETPATHTESAAEDAESVEAKAAKTIAREVLLRREHLATRVALAREARERIIDNRGSKRLAQQRSDEVGEPRAVTPEIPVGGTVAALAQPTHTESIAARSFEAPMAMLAEIPESTSRKQENEQEHESEVRRVQPPTLQMAADTLSMHLETPTSPSSLLSLRENIERRFTLIDTMLTRATPLLKNERADELHRTLTTLRTRYSDINEGLPEEEAALRATLDALYTLLDEVRDAIDEHRRTTTDEQDTVERKLEPADTLPTELPKLQRDATELRERIRHNR